MQSLPVSLRRFGWWIPAICCYGVISWFSSQSGLPGPETEAQQFVWFKSAHVIVYATLTFTVWLAWMKNGLTDLRLELATWYVLVIASSLDELHQQFTPGRTGRISDVLIDLVAAWAVLQILRRYNRTTIHDGM